MKAIVSHPPAGAHKADPLTRAVLAHVRAAAFPRTTVADAAAKLFPNDRTALALVTRAEAPVGTTDGWGAAVTSAPVFDFLDSLAPVSAISRIMGRGIVMPLEGLAGASVPCRSTNPVPASGVAEGDPIPVRANTLSGVVLTPGKAAVISAFSRELAKRANGQAVITQILREDAGATLDAAYLSTATAGALPAGLLHGVAPIGGYGGGDRTAMEEDLAALAASVAAVGSGNVTFVMSPARAAKLRIKAPDIAREIVVLPSIAVPADRVIALDAAALVHGFGTEPQIEASEAALLHMDSDPAAIVDGTAAAPVRSLWQTDGIGIRLILDVAFGKRSATSVAYVDNATW